MKLYALLLEVEIDIIKQQMSNIENSIKKKEQLLRVNKKYPSNDKKVARKQDEEYKEQLNNLEIRLKKKETELDKAK